MKPRFPFHSNQVWPPPLLVVPFIFIYGMLVLSLRLILLSYGHYKAALRVEDPDVEEIKNIKIVLLAGGAMVYALYRIWRFHPRCNSAYLVWLRLTPWTADKPLPLGPVHPVWQDAVVIGVLTLIAKWQAHLDPLLPAVAFGLAYLGGMTLVLLATRQRVSFLLGFLWPALILPFLNAIGFGLVCAAIVAVIWYGHRQSLRAFPWGSRTAPVRPAGSLMHTEIPQLSATGAPANVGWPFTVLGPKIRCLSIPTPAAFGFSALFGWWSFCLIECAQDGPPPEAIIVLTALIAFMRVGIYCSGVVTPFNIFGRFASGKLIIPGFDQVFLTPLVAVLVSLAGGIIIRHSGSWYPFVDAVVIGLICLVLFGGGPTRRKWVLTGDLRFSLPRRANNRLLRQV